MHPNADLKAFYESFDDGMKRYVEQSKKALTEASLKFGVSCWHKNEYESEAMWRLHSSECIAVESTIGQLHSSIKNQGNVIIENVRYMDFENDQIEKGYKHYGLFLKRKSFEHEKEVRAVLLLNGEGKGAGAFIRPSRS